MAKIVFNLILLSGAFSILSFIEMQQPYDVKAAMVRGKKVYNKTCVACHQPDGSGVPRMNPPLIKTKITLGSKEKLVHILVKGFNEEVEINGQYYSNPMPAQPQLTNQEIADVLTFVRKSFGNKASHVTLAEVKAIRAKIK
ncbi:MAG: cytochrome c [Lacibacter sp.]